MEQWLIIILAVIGMAAPLGILFWFLNEMEKRKRRWQKIWEPIIAEDHANGVHHRCSHD